METQKTIRAALLGCGTVGGGVYKLLNRRKEELAEKYERKYREFQKYYPALKAL